MYSYGKFRKYYWDIPVCTFSYFFLPNFTLSVKVWTNENKMILLASHVSTTCKTDETDGKQR